ncbi:MAG: PAS domain S-box protein [Rhodothermaceae bacterium]
MAERSLIESEEKYRALINNMQDGVFVLRDLKFSFVNAAFAIMVGYRSEDLIGLSPKRLIAREDFRKVLKKYILISAGEKLAEEHEFRLIHRASGNFVYVNATFSVIHYQGSYALLGTIKNITIRKRQEEQLRKLSTAVEQSPTGIIITNLDGNIEYVNPRFSEITGYGIHEAVKKKPSILNSGMMDNEVYQELWNTVKAGNIWRGELCNRKKNGELYWISCAIAPIKDETGELTHFIAVQTDITFQKFAREQIETQQQQLSSILNNMPLILFALDKEDKFTFLRGKGLELFNIESSRFAGRSIDLVFRKSPHLIDDFHQAIKEPNQTRVVREIGEYYFEIHLIPVFNANNEYSGINGIAYDVTQRFKTQRALEESEERYRSLYENSSVGIYRSTKNGFILMANPTLIKMLGYESIEELSKYNLEDENFNIKYDRTEFVKRLEKDGVVKGLETIWIRKDHQILYVRESARRIANHNNITLYYDGVIEDITDMKLAEQQLVKSEARNRAMLYAIPDIMLEITFDGEILAAHIKDSDAEILKLPALLIGKNIFELTNEFLAEKTRLSISRVIETKSVETFEFTIKHQNKVHFFESRFVISGAASVIVMLRDITDRKEGEKMLIKAKNEAEKSDKLKSEFLAQMSHEIRTPINSILSFTSLIKEEMIDKVEDDLKVCFDVIDNGGHRLIRTIDSILNMSQLQSGTYQPIFTEVDMDKDVLRNAVAELKQRAKEKNLELEYTLNTQDAIVKADNYTVGQIFINLIDNAIKYTEAGKVKVNVKRNESHKLVIDVQDTGIGISEEYIPNLFKPFSQEESGYTRRYEGNGLGLALVKNYVEINNAYIEVESRKGEGTKFGVTFN